MKERNDNTEKAKIILETANDDQLSLGDVIDRQAFQSMMEDFHRLTNIASAMFDISGKVLVAVGFKDICRKFHRVHPETLKNCQESDPLLSEDFPTGSFKHYRCKNNLRVMSTPIGVDGRRLGNISFEQFFYDDENVDREVFRNQARKYGFDEEEYLAALDRVPRIDRKTMDTAIRLYARLAGMISTLSYDGLTISHALSQKNIAIQRLAESEAQQRALLHTAMDGFWMTDMRGRLLDVNQTYCRMSGYSAQELLAMRIADLDVMKTIDDIALHAKQIVKQGEDRFESRHRRKDGSVFDVEVSVQYRPVEGGRMVAFLRDITERMRIEETLKKASERRQREADVVATIAASKNLTDGAFRQLAVELTAAASRAIEIERVGIWLLEDGETRLVNLDNFIASSAEHSSGAVLLEKEFQNEFDAFKAAKYIAANEPLTDPRTAGYVETYLKPNRIASMLDAVIRLGGKTLGTICFEHVDTPHQWEEDEIAFACQLADQMALAVSNYRRRLSELALRKSEERYRMLLDQAADGVVLTDRTGGYLNANKSFLNMLGYSIEELMKLHISDVVFKGERSFATSSPAGNASLSEWRLARKGGSTIPVEISMRMLSGGKRLAIVRDITDRKRAEMELRESEDKFRMAFDASPDAVNINRLKDGLYVDINAGFTRLTGFTLEDIAGKTSFDINIWHDPEDREKLVRALREKGFCNNLEARFRRKDGGLTSALMSARLISIHNVPHVISITRDISDRKKAEEEKIALETHLQKAQKMEAIGTLAGGIAHDFNNILFPIIGRCEIMLGDKEADSGPMRHVKSILDSARRASDLVRQILAFSRQSETGKMPVKIQKIIREVLSLIRHSIPSTIDIALSIDETCDVVLADASQIHQVIMNLIGNAYHAMEETGGRLEIGLNVIQLGPDNAPETTLPPGRYVDLHVSDTGSGIDEKIIGRIFDPYFTTKESGKGTGLGLAVSYGIVKKHGGAIQVSSRPGEGSTFHVYLPVMETGFEEKASGPGAIVRGGTEQILFVDDEFDIVDTAIPMLERLGYRVTARTGSVDALEAFRNDPDRFDIVITDMTMPNMTGVQLAGEIHKIRPGFPIILITGFSMRIDENNAGQMGISALVMKPIVRDQLAVAIRRILDGDGD